VISGVDKDFFANLIIWLLEMP